MKPMKTPHKLLYTVYICAIMEFGMAYYNYFFHTNAFLHEAFLLAIIEFLPAFLMGFLCEWYFISKMAKRISIYLHREHFSDNNIDVINRLLIAVGMVIVVSIYGAILHTSSEDPFLLLVFNNIAKNALFGIAFFMFCVHPSAVWLLSRLHTK